MAKRRRDIIEPTAPTSSAVTGLFTVLKPTTMRPRRARRSSRLPDRARIAIISEAVTMSKPVSRSGALIGPPMPVTMLLRERSSISRTRRHVMPGG